MANIQPFEIAIPDADLVDLGERLRRTRWPEPECVDDWSQGIPLSYTRELADYWAHEYDWRAREAALNRFTQFTTEIDGLPIHYIHQRSTRDDAFPLIITHGWPGSIVEFAKVIEPLNDAGFHVVCPSLPGYGFSGKPAETGWGIDRIARAWDVLMVRLGYDRYGAQGGDWGSVITTQIGRNIGNCVGIHTNMPIGRPPKDIGEPTEEEKQTGLMYRKELPDGKGMLFDFSPEQQISMWMKNTYIPLDMIFIRADGRILRIAENTEPFSTKIISSGGLARGVLEVIGGTAQKYGIQPGDRVGHPLFSKR